MLRYIAIAICLACLVSALQAATVPEIATVESKFFGYQSGVNRDFTNYGQGFADPVSQDTGWHEVLVRLADFDGDGVTDSWAYDPKTGSMSIRFGKKTGGFGKAVCTRLRGVTGGMLLAADFNGDNYCDIALYESNACPDGFLFLFGRGNGTFGPTAAEAKSKAATHLMAKFTWTLPAGAVPIAGQFDDDGAADIGYMNPKTGQVVTRIQTGEPAYDYSVHLVKDGTKYKMWHGGRWRTLDINDKGMPGWDGDHAMYAWSPDGHKWFRKIDGPAFLKGFEEGAADSWYENNYLEPEVLKVGGTYYMFWQVEIDPGSKTDTGEKAINQCDRIGLSTSKDGMNWRRKTDRGVVINITDPTITNLDHHEAIYVPDDPDGKPWWLYTFHFIEGKPAGHVRMRSSDPTTFDWAKREPVNGMAQIGNQIGYADEAPGGRVFVRITFTGDGDRTVPVLQLSRDGLNWEAAQTQDGKTFLLASSENDKDNKNVYFLGMSTIDGTGKIERLKDGRFHILYGATTSNGPGQPHIWKSEIGVGEAFFTFSKEKE